MPAIVCILGQNIYSKLACSLFGIVSVGTFQQKCRDLVSCSVLDKRSFQWHIDVVIYIVGFKTEKKMSFSIKDYDIGSDVLL